MASRVGACSAADIGRLTTEARRKREATATVVKPPERPVFELHYTIVNCGDGSAVVELHGSAAAARAAEEAEPEPFAEPTAGAVKLRIGDDGGSIERCDDEGTWVKLSLAGK